MEKRPKDRLTPPALGGPPAPRLAIEANKLPIRGAYLSFLSLSQLKFALPRLLTIPSPQGAYSAYAAFSADKNWRCSGCLPSRRSRTGT